MNIDIRPQRVRENSRSCWRTPSYGICRNPFKNFRASFYTFPNTIASRGGMGCLNSTLMRTLLTALKTLSSALSYRCRLPVGEFTVKQATSHILASRIVFSKELHFATAVATRCSSFSVNSMLWWLRQKRLVGGHRHYEWQIIDEECEQHRRGSNAL